MLSIRRRARATELADIRRELAAYCAGLGLPEPVVCAVVLAANEACTAAIGPAASVDDELALELHAWIGRPEFLHADPAAPFETDGATDRALYVSTRDRRQAAGDGRHADPLGARCIRALADDVHVIDHGSVGAEVVLEFRLGAGR